MANTKVTAPKVAFVDTFTMAMSLGLPTVGLHTIENPPDPVLMSVTMHARLVIANPLEASG